MEWIKTILEKHTGEDGVLNLVEAQKEINAEFPKNAVPKADFNSKVEELKTANETLNTLQKDNKDVEALQTTIADYKTQVETLENERGLQEKDFAIKLALKEANPLDDGIVMSLLDKDTIKVTEGKLQGFTEQLDTLKESKPFLFQQPEPEADKTPHVSVGGQPKAPGKTETDAFSAAVQKFI